MTSSARPSPAAVCLPPETAGPRRGSGPSPSSRPDPRPVAVISGVTSGLGRLTTEALVARGYRVIGLVRSASRSGAVLAAVRALAPGPLPAPAPAPAPSFGPSAGPGSLELVLCDLSSLRSVRRAVAEIRERTTRIDLLMNNAGGLASERTITDEGVETTVASNYLGPAGLTLCLLPLLRRAGRARVVNVASQAHVLAGHPAWADFARSVPRHRFRAYAWAKLALIVFTRALAERVARQGIEVFAFHPGVVRTEFARRTGGWLQWAAAIARPLMGSAADGADALTWLATTPLVPAPSGAFFDRRTPRSPSRAARDEDAAGRLWALTTATLGCPDAPDADRAAA